MGISPKHLCRTSKLDVRDEAIKVQIQETHKAHPAYGHRRVAWHLKLNHKRIVRVMKKFGIKPPRRKAHVFCTRSTSHHSYTNLIKGFTPTRAHELWCSDVSFFWFQGRFWYLATIEDIFTRQIVGAQVGKYHNAQLVLTTLKQAIATTGKIPKIFHSDQGTEFMAHVCTTYLEILGVTISVSDKASPWQNGFQESLFSRFKEETGDFNRFDSIGEFIEAIYAHIHYYNHDRIHTALKMPPAVFATQVSDNPLHVWGT